VAGGKLAYFSVIVAWLCEVFGRKRLNPRRSVKTTHKIITLLITITYPLSIFLKIFKTPLLPIP